MKLAGTSCKSHEISQTVLETQHAFFMKITKKTQRKCRKISNAVYKEKDSIWKRESRKKGFSPRTATVEMEMQRKSELVETSYM